MRSMPLAFAATLMVATLSLAACHSTKPAAETPPPPAEAATDSSAAAPVASANECNATAAQPYVGQSASPDVIEAARLAAGAATVRTTKPNQPVTMDYRADRLNLRTDESAVIESVACG
jgi:hypothetical protein